MLRVLIIQIQYELGIWGLLVSVWSSSNLRDVKESRPQVGPRRSMNLLLLSEHFSDLRHCHRVVEQPWRLNEELGPAWCDTRGRQAVASLWLEPEVGSTPSSLRHKEVGPGRAPVERVMVTRI